MTKLMYIFTNVSNSYINMLNRISLLSFIFVSALCLNSCSSDDDDDNVEVGTSSALTINNVKVGKTLYTLCEISGSPKEIVFEAHFDYSDEGLMSLDLAVPTITSISQLKKGMELSDDIVIYKFYSMTGSFVGHKNYEVLDGSVKIESISSTAVVLKFSNFEFLRELGNDEQTFKVNGTVSYSIND